MTSEIDDSSGIVISEPDAPVPPPDILTLVDLVSDVDIILAKESVDKGLIESIGIQRVQVLKPKLVEWVMKGYPNAYPILSIAINAPEKCSDGEARTLTEYIEFCSGKSIHDHVALLQVKLPDISVSFSYDGTSISIVVSKMA